MPDLSITVIQALANLLNFHGKSVSPTTLSKNLPGGELNDKILLVLAQGYNFKAKVAHLRQKSLHGANFPLIAFLYNGDATLVLAVNDLEVLLQSGWNNYPTKESIALFKERWSGKVLLGRPVETIGETARFGLITVASLIWQHRSVVSLVFLASLAVQILGLASPLIFEMVVDKVLPNHTVGTLTVLTIALVGTAAFEFVSDIFRTYLINHTASRVDLELGIKLFKHLMGLPLSYFGARRAGVIITRMREIESLRSFLTGSALTSVMDATFAVVFFIAMYCYSSKLFIFELFTVPFYVIICLVMAPLFRLSVNAKFNAGSKNQSFLVEAVSGIETVKALGSERAFSRIWNENLERFVNAALNVNTISSIGNKAVQFFSKVTTTGILYIGAYEVMSGRLTIGGLVAFNMLSQKVTSPILRLSQLWQDFYQVKVSADRIGDIMDTPLERPMLKRGVALQRLCPSISFDGVSFKYQIDGPLVLSGLNMRVLPEETVGIVGPSGCGKSTIAKLVQGLYSPSVGVIRIGNHDVASYDLEWLRDQIGVVSQESFLFNGTIIDNISLFTPGASMEKIIGYAKVSGAHDFIMRLPDGYHTVISERGASLSGGQRQRLALARTLAREPKILVLDEATSALDYESEAAIQENMPEICAGRTVLIIAHRLTAVRRCDRIIVVENGQVAEEGPHAALIQNRGRYFDLFSSQDLSIE
ncbi:type I secretion system permease/ATPase [Gluconacetobacter diazotrophicus]|uniref:Type I secretion system permease/ATPase n=1 Tax=Gluconacetobacter diazotrophicus TaxID=33996 RepID=A0A7W4I8R1_GLUDI|nr:type I secretion system permease/ATPase [Gluconacetobacter diazotrophicus]MBB2158281.1 type I secretion system permease/ATPase [Gluconacetobacter diazotrophicus]